MKLTYISKKILNKKSIYTRYNSIKGNRAIKNLGKILFYNEFNKKMLISLLLRLSLIAFVFSYILLYNKVESYYSFKEIILVYRMEN